MRNPTSRSLVLKSFGFAIAFLAVAFTARSYGPSRFGLVSTSIFAQYLICEIADSGFSTYLARRIATDTLPLQTWLSFLPRILFRSLLAMVFWTIGVILVTRGSYNHINLLLALNIPFWLLNSYFQQIAYAKNRLASASIQNFLQNSLLISIFFLREITFDFYEVGVVLASFLSFLYSYGATQFENNIFAKEKLFKLPKLVFNLFEQDGKLLASSRIFGVLTYMDNLVITILYGPTIAGYYTIASRMRTILPTGLISVSETTFHIALKTKQIRKIFGSFEIRIIVVSTLIISLLMLINSSQIIDLLYGADYEKSEKYFQLFIFISVTIGFVQILKNLLIAWGQDVFLRKILYLSILIQLPLFLLFFMLFSSYAIPLALLGSNIFLLIKYAKEVILISRKI